jgi:four helix bundle protein
MVEEPNKNYKYDLDDRFVEFASRVIDVVEKMPKNLAAKHLSGQLVRSGTSPALNYGEAQAAESTADFVHKLKLVQKELRETKMCLRIIQKRNYFAADRLIAILKENDELLAIVYKSIDTARKNDSK